MKRKALLRKLFNIQGGVCAYCEKPMDITTCNKPNSPTVDHIIPKSKGGTCDPFNLVCACQACNSAKADMPLVVFIGKKKKTYVIIT